MVRWVLGQPVVQVFSGHRTADVEALNQVAAIAMSAFCDVKPKVVAEVLEPHKYKRWSRRFGRARKRLTRPVELL